MGKLLELGLTATVFSGIQIDINAVRKKIPGEVYVETSLCDHNCTKEVGGYDCPAAFTLNKGIKPEFAPTKVILEWIDNAAAGLRMARDNFIHERFDLYCYEMGIPNDVRHELLLAQLNNSIEVNLFGGNPEMHPEIIPLIGKLKKLGFKVNVTTTGRKFMTSKSFLGEFLSCRPDVLALSADDFQIENLDELLKMQLEEIRMAWKKIPPTQGQKQKCLEALYTAKLLTEQKEPVILFNMVLHPGNIFHFGELFSKLVETFPQVLINPYPMQTLFQYEASTFTLEHLFALEKVIDFMIIQTVAGNANVVKRLHYWLSLKAAFVTFHGQFQEIANFVSGKVWRCYQQPGSMYLQIGQGQKNRESTHEYAGGHLGCFWNDETITQKHQVTVPNQSAYYIVGGATALASISPAPCPGCAFPRLMFNQITTELGLHPSILPAYFRLRKEYAGF